MIPLNWEYCLDFTVVLSAGVSAAEVCPFLLHQVVTGIDGWWVSNSVGLLACFAHFKRNCDVVLLYMHTQGLYSHNAAAEVI